MNSENSAPSRALWLGIAACLAILVPVLWSGYAWDDNVNASLLGLARLKSLSLPELVGREILALFRGQGRFFPLSSLGTFAIAGLDRLGYKVFLVALTLLSLGFVALFAEVLTGEGRKRDRVLLLSPLFLQIRFESESLTSFHGILQLLSILLFGSWIAYVSHLKTGRLPALLLSVGLYFLSLFVYEAAYPFFVVHGLLSLSFRPRGTSPLRAWSRAWPFALATFAAVFAVLAFRSMADMPVQGVNGAYIPSFAPGPFLGTLLRQLSGAVPLSYSLGHQHGVDIVSVFSDRSLLARALGPAVATFALVFLGLRRNGPASARSNGTLAGIGAAIWFLSGLLISLSPKYQQRNWVNWGLAYLPGYLGALGALLLCTALWSRRERSGAAGIGAASIALFTLLSNVGVVARSNALFRNDRDAAVDALRAGILDQLPPNTSIVSGTRAYPGPSLSFLRTHAPQAEVKEYLAFEKLPEFRRGESYLFSFRGNAAGQREAVTGEIDTLELRKEDAAPLSVQLRHVRRFRDGVLLPTSDHETLRCSAELGLCL